jgi:3-hydroxyisobutyrate dehydrogenase
MKHTMLSPDKTRIGWIGTGVMGAAMCGHLLRAGFAVTVFNRPRAKAEPLLDGGARWADSPRAVAEASDVIFTIVGFPADVRRVILGPDGVLAGCRRGAIIVDMTTSEPRLAEEIARVAEAKGVVAIDAPVSGGDVGARQGTLSIMLGGDAAAIESLRPCWQAMGKTFVRHGGPGAGQHAKLANQILIAGNMIGLCEGLLYAHRAGLAPEKLLQSVSGGAAGSWSLANLGPRIIAGDFAPGFMVEHFVKDLGIALDEAARMRLCLPGLALARQLYLSLMAHDRGRLGTQALQLALAELSAVERPSSYKTPAPASAPRSP